MRATFPERAIIFRRAALVGVAGEEEGVSRVRLQPLADGIKLAPFRAARWSTCRNRK